MVVWSLVVAGLLGLGLWNLSGPPMWWDEGWTLSVARNWVETGHYGRFLAGEPAPPGLSASFPTVAGVALSFQLFGVGIWQGRLFIVVGMIVSLLASYYLAARLYNRTIAIGTLVFLLLLTMHPQLHPLIQGRQVIAEMTMYSLLLGGYICFYHALQRSFWWLIPTWILWGVALSSKAQVEPFWLAALLVPMLAVLIKRQWRMAGLLLAGLAGSFLFDELYNQLLWAWLSNQTIVGDGVTGLRELIGFVLLPANRLLALRIVLFAGLLPMMGLLYALWREGWQWWQASTLSAPQVLRLSLLALAGSWFAWFLLLSVGTPRYFFPPVFLGSMFVAVALHDFTGGFRVKETLDRVVLALKEQAWLRAIGSLCMIVLLTLVLSVTLLTFYRYYITYSSTSAVEVANFFHTQTPPDTLIETYESELHFLLDRPYHYPPDQVHVELNRRAMWLQEVEIDYDPLAADPDYLVTGEFVSKNDLYAPVLETDAFRLVETIGNYKIYERVRSGAPGP
jgi:hypothetical protein